MDIKLGEIRESHAMERDAVHVAVAGVIAAEDLKPGDRVRMSAYRPYVIKAYESGDSIGIVDPFLRKPVNEGESFWLFMQPGTVTGLRHEWDHPNFEADGNSADDDYGELKDDGCRDC